MGERILSAGLHESSISLLAHHFSLPTSKSRTESNLMYDLFSFLVFWCWTAYLVVLLADFWRPSRPRRLRPFALGMFCRRFVRAAALICGSWITRIIRVVVTACPA